MEKERKRHSEVLIQFIVGRVGLTEISIPRIRIGKGKPVTTIITGIHGNETTGLLILQELLKAPPDIFGTLQLIMAANPLALIERKRACFLDQVDMNRVFPGDPNGTITQRVAAKAREMLMSSDCVIDIHSFEMDTPLMGIMVNSSQNEKNEELLERFSPEQVWVILPEKREEQQFGKSLSAILNELGIPNFALETTCAERITSEEITAAANGIKRIITNSPLCSKKRIPFFLRTKINTRESGIFTPHINIFHKVKKGDVIGTITIFPEVKELLIHAPVDGIVMQLMHRGFVLIGEEIAALGTPWRKK